MFSIKALELFWDLPGSSFKMFPREKAPIFRARCSAVCKCGPVPT